jgi:hypothetical protein
MLLSVILVCGINVTTGRPLLFAGLGAAPLIAQFIWKTADAADPLFWRGYRAMIARTVCAWLVLLHLVFSPVHFALRVLDRPPKLLDLDPVLNLSAVHGTPDQDLIVVNAPDTFAFLYFSSLCAFRAQSFPAHVRVLAPGSTPVTVVRHDSATISVRPSDGYLLPPGSTIGDPGGSLPPLHPAYYFQHFDETFRIPAFPMPLHSRVELTGMTAEVTSLTGDGRPSEARFHFASRLESGHFTWVMWDWGREAFVGFSIPAIGDSTKLPGPPAHMPIGLELFSGRER